MGWWWPSVRFPFGLEGVPFPAREKGPWRCEEKASTSGQHLALFFDALHRVVDGGVLWLSNQAAGGHRLIVVVVMKG